MSDEEKLLVVDWMPLGTRFEELRKRVPEASDPKSEGPRLTDSTFKDSIFGYPATFEMNYENGELYSASWFLKIPLDTATSDSLQTQVSQIYSKRFGSPFVTEGADVDYVVRSHIWCWKGGSASVSLFGTEKPYRSLSGGFGVRCPDDRALQPRS